MARSRLSDIGIISQKWIKWLIFRILLILWKYAGGHFQIPTLYNFNERLSKNISEIMNAFLRQKDRKKRKFLRTVGIVWRRGRGIDHHRGHSFGWGWRPLTTYFRGRRGRVRVWLLIAIVGTGSPISSSCVSGLGSGTIGQLPLDWGTWRRSASCQIRSPSLETRR